MVVLTRNGTPMFDSKGKPRTFATEADGETFLAELLRVLAATAPQSLQALRFALEPFQPPAPAGP
jgi:hypothetical protein